MTNKKFKMAAMSLALTACVATAPLAANAEAPEETPDAGVSAATEHAETPEAEAPVEEVPVEEETPEENPPVEETPRRRKLPRRRKKLPKKRRKLLRSRPLRRML